jgi:hypothetical protein
LWVAALEIVEHDALDSSEPTKEKKVVITPAQGIADSLPAEEKQYLQELAVDLTSIVADGHPVVALQRLDNEKLESDQKVALWSFLDSRTRSAIKKAKEV